MQQTGNARLPREARLRGHDRFGQIFRRGEGLRRGQLVVKYTVSEESSGEGVRAGFVVRRGAGSAPRRNRLRRLLREAYRARRSSFVASLPGALSLDLVLLWSGSPEQALRPNFATIDAEMSAALDALARRIRKRADGRAEQR